VKVSGFVHKPFRNGRDSAQRPYELRAIWDELIARGPRWRQWVIEAVSLLD
jgi:hypothetical protein